MDSSTKLAQPNQLTGPWMGIDKKHDQLLSQQSERKVSSMFSSVSGHPYTGFELLSESLFEEIKMEMKSRRAVRRIMKINEQEVKVSTSGQAAVQMIHQ